MSVKICTGGSGHGGGSGSLVMLCLHHVPRSGIIWFSSVLATGGRRWAPSPAEDWLWLLWRFQNPGGAAIR